MDVVEKLMKASIVLWCCVLLEIHAKYTRTYCNSVICLDGFFFFFFLKRRVIFFCVFVVLGGGELFFFFFFWWGFKAKMKTLLCVCTHGALTL